jgi:hypothetical protein
MEASILIPPNRQLEFHVHMDASLLAVGAMLAQKPMGKYDQPIVYAFRMLKKVEHNYTIAERKALVMVYALHKFKYFLLGKKLFFM